MRIALVYFPAKGSDALVPLAKAMARTFEAAGHFVDVIEARADESPHLTGYDYIVFGTESAGAFGKIPEGIPHYLAQAGMLTGKRSMAFFRKGGLRPEKALFRLMKAMEVEGMMVNYSDIVASESAASEIAREAPVERR